MEWYAAYAYGTLRLRVVINSARAYSYNIALVIYVLSRKLPNLAARIARYLITHVFPRITQSITTHVIGVFRMGNTRVMRGNARVMGLARLQNYTRFPSHYTGPIPAHVVGVRDYSITHVFPRIHVIGVFFGVAFPCFTYRGNHM